METVFKMENQEKIPLKITLWNLKRTSKNNLKRIFACWGKFPLKVEQFIC